MICDCIFCGSVIEIGQQCVKIDVGSLEKDDFGGIGFENPVNIGYAHFSCADAKKEINLKQNGLQNPKSK